MNDSDDHQHDADDCIKTVSADFRAGRSSNSKGGEPFRRIEILTGTARRKTWPKAFKAQVIAETFEPGANVSAIARRHGVSIGLVHYWRKTKLELGLSQISKKSTLAGAINYSLNRWEGLTLFLSDGRLEVDNNTVERSIRGIAQGRRGSLFAGDDGGAHTWAVLGSLLTTAKLYQRH